MDISPICFYGIVWFGMTSGSTLSDHDLYSPFLQRASIAAQQNFSIVVSMAKKHRVYMVEDHQLFREGVKSMLNGRGDIDIIGETEDGLDAVREIRRVQPEMVLLDLSIPKMSGISVIKEIKRDLPETRILALTIHESDQYVLEAFDAGVDGYCIKDASRQELMVAIDSVLQGKLYISPGVSDQVIEGYLNGRKSLREESVWDTVTQREREVLKLLAEGFSNKQIATFLHISVKTVEKHRSNLINKLDLHNVAQLTSYAIQKGLVEAKR
ncbi:MAG: response regulator [Desulforhopalus sp.]